MSTIYKKHNAAIRRRVFRLLGLTVFLFGFVILMYLSYPLLSWKLFNEPALATQDVASPIPKTTVINRESIRSLFAATADTLIGVDYTNANNWYPSIEKSMVSKNATYFLSIPKINVQNAIVSSADTNLKEHLVQYRGTATPPQKGTTVVFGHSTLPQLFNPTDYMTIFANAHTLKNGDTINVSIDGKEYVYKIFSIIVTDPEDATVLAQDYEDSYLTIITCTPPGTIWKRLIVKSRLEMI